MSGSPDALVIDENAPVNATNAGMVIEGGTLSLEGKLVTADKDNGPTELVYTVRSLPQKGALKKDGTDLAVGGTFTQKDVSDGKITYVHNGAEGAADGFTWSLTDGNTTLPPTGTLTFDIAVTNVNDLPSIVNNPVSTIAEGGNEVLTMARLAAADAESTDLTFTLLAVTRGTLEKEVATVFSAIAINGTFTQQDIVDGKIRFVDPGTDDAMLANKMNTTASFMWKVSDPDGGVNPATGGNLSTFTITAVDDAPTVTWKTMSCAASGTNVNANPISNFIDPDNLTSEYQVCIVAIGGGTHVTPSTTAGPGTTTTVMPVVQNGAVTLAVGACIAANALGNLNLDSTANQNRGSITWRLMKGIVQIGGNQIVGFPVSPTSC